MSLMGEETDIVSGTSEGEDAVFRLCMLSDGGDGTEVMCAVCGGLSCIMEAIPARPSSGLPFPS